MKAMRNKSWMASSFLMTVLLLGVLSSVPARAEVSEEMDNGHPHVANQLMLFKQTALEMQRHADQLDAMTLSKQLDWRTHAASLTTLKQHVNELGRTLASLEELKPVANEGQRLAIENARPHLVGVAQEVTRAINLLSDGRKNVYMLPYTETVGDLSGHAASLYETVDTLMDYEKARIRLLNLELPSSSEGS